MANSENTNDCRELKAANELDRKLIDAMESGESTEMTAKDWEHIRYTVRQRLADKAKGGK